MHKVTNRSWAYVYRICGVVGLGLIALTPLYYKLIVEEDGLPKEHALTIAGIWFVMPCVLLYFTFRSAGTKMSDGSKIYTLKDSSVDPTKAFEDTPENVSNFINSLKSEARTLLDTSTTQGTAPIGFLDSTFNAEDFTSAYVSTSGKRFLVPYTFKDITKSDLRWFEPSSDGSYYEVLTRNDDNTFTNTGHRIYQLPEIIKA